MPARRQPFLTRAVLPLQRGEGVLQVEGGGAGQDGDRDRRGGFLAGHGAGGAARSWRWCRAVHRRAPKMTSAWRASHRAAAGPSTTRIFHRAFIPPGVFVSPKIIDIHGAFRNRYR